MNCPICNEPTRAVRTVSSGAGGKAVERRCPNDHRWTYALLLVGAIEKRGDGPHAVATKIAEGKNPIPELEHDQEEA